MTSSRGNVISRRHLFHAAGAFAAMAATSPVWADGFVDLDLPSEPVRRELTGAFPQKGQMILQRSRPPLLETPFEVFDRDVFTPNDQFFVRWHWAAIPPQIDVATFRVAIRAGCFSRASREGNGKMVRWAMRAGLGCAYATCLIALASKPAPFPSVSTAWTSRSWTAPPTSLNHSTSITPAMAKSWSLLR